MKKALLLLLLLLTVVGCNIPRVNPYYSIGNNPSKNDEISKKTPNVKRITTYILDTLLSQIDLNKDHLYYDTLEEFTLVKELVNNHEVLVIAVPYSSIMMFEKNGGDWALLDSVQYDDYFLRYGVEDINGDGKKDLIIKGGYNSNGNYRSTIFLSNKQGKLHYCHTPTLWVLKFDKSTGYLKSCIDGGWHGNGKELYQWKSDSLVLIRGADMSVEFGNDSIPGYIIISFYSIKGDTIHEDRELIISDSDKGKDGHGMWDTAIFKSYPAD